MAMQLKEDGETAGEMHEINVTPFIDVMLVLLIIFMVAAPLATVDVKVNLPSSVSKPTPRPEKPVYLSIRDDKQLFVGDDKVTEPQLIETVIAQTHGDKQTILFLRADKRVDYATLMSVMDKLRQAGYLKIGLVGLESPGTSSP